MIYENVEFHGVADLRSVPGESGLRLQRIPESVRRYLNEKAALRMLAPDGAEIRFVAGGENIEVTLSSAMSECEVVVFWGGFQDIKRYTVGRKPTTLKLSYPQRLRQMMEPQAGISGFSPSVWRLTLRGKDKHGVICFHDIQGDNLRPPDPSELPKQTYLAYGTSITDGFGATAMHMSFIAQLARQLGANFINLGSAGSAYCEPQLAEYIAQRDDWDFATLELSLNMIGGGFDVEAFSQRARYMVETVADGNPTRPVVCITNWNYFGNLCHHVQGPHGSGLNEAYRQALRKIVSDCNRANIHLLEGADLLHDVTNFSIDLAHPGDAGMTQIAQNLSNRMKIWIKPK